MTPGSVLFVLVFNLSEVYAINLFASSPLPDTCLHANLPLAQQTSILLEVPPQTEERHRLDRILTH